MVFYICNKCNKEFNRKCNYINHINRKFTCNKILVTNTDNLIVENIITNDSNFVCESTITHKKNYKCEKCYKEFNKKSNYIAHINKKNSCTSNNLIDENKILLYKIKKLENKIINITEENDILKITEKNDILKITEEKDVLKRENIKLNELLNYKDADIKKINDNNKDNNNDIKIKLVQEYVYIIRECDFVRLNEDIYKIGRTSKTNPEDRFQKYRKGTEIVAFFKVNNSIECENKMIKCFSNHINIKKMDEYGKEYFQGNRNELLSEILKIVINYNT
jgi:uncharacterized C2H2 Zn-finger protein